MESLVQAVARFLEHARSFYGLGDLVRPPSLEFTGAIALRSIPGASATLNAANDTTEALSHWLESRFDRDEHVGRLMNRVCDSIECGRKVVAEESELFKSAVGGLGPAAGSPAGFTALLGVLGSILSTVTGQVQGNLGEMTEVSDGFFGDSDSERESAFLASNLQQSGVLGSVFDFLASVSGLPYNWGNTPQEGPLYGYDCSGLVSAVANILGGLPPDHDRTSTAGMGPFLAARGARRGPGGIGTVEVGWYDGPQYPGGGHTAGTVHLAEGSINFESSSNGVKFGGPRGARDGFGNIMHFQLA